MAMAVRESLKKSSVSARGTRNAGGRLLKCCGLTCALLLTLAIALLIIALTVFNPKNPHLRIQSLHIQTFHANSPPPAYTPSVRLTVHLLVSVYNPNFAALRYSSGSASTSLFYHGQLAGKAPIAAGAVAARHTLTLTSVVSFRSDDIVTNPSLLPDFNAGEFPVSTQTTISGRVTVLKLLKRHTVATSACNISLSVRTQSLEYFICNYPSRLAGSGI